MYLRSNIEMFLISGWIDYDITNMRILNDNHTAEWQDI